MQWFHDKFVFISVHALCIILEVATSFLSDAIMYEATTGVTFNWWLLFTNRFFWIVLILQCLYSVLAGYTAKKNKESDNRLQHAIEREQIVLVNQITRKVKRGDFHSAHEIIEIIEKLHKRGE